MSNLTSITNPHAIKEFKVGMVFTVEPAYIEWYRIQARGKPMFTPMRAGDVCFLRTIYPDGESGEFVGVGNPFAFILKFGYVSSHLHYEGGTFTPDTKGSTNE